MSRVVKLVDVAREAEVDVATVSRALNRSPGWERLSQKCVERVEATARKLNYRPNVVARGLRRRRSDIIGIMAPAFGTAFNRDLLAGLESALRGRGLDALLLGGVKPSVDAAITSAREGRIDGVLAPAFSLSATERQKLRQSKVPLVLTHLPPESRGVAGVALDEAQGIQLAVEHLVGLGHQHLHWAGPSPKTHESGARRAQAFRLACQGMSVQFSEIVTAQCDLGTAEVIESARAALSPLLQKSQRPTALVCYHDPIALGALVAARRANVEVPQDLSIIGFDDTFGDVADPPLTTLSHQPIRMAEAAVDVLLEILTKSSDAEFGSNPIKISPELVQRESTSRFRH